MFKKIVHSLIAIVEKSSEARATFEMVHIGSTPFTELTNAMGVPGVVRLVGTQTKVKSVHCVASEVVARLVDSLPAAVGVCECQRISASSCFDRLFVFQVSVIFGEI